MDTTENITFNSKLTFWDKFKCVYLLDFYSRISLYGAKKWKRRSGHLVYTYILIVTPIVIVLEDNLGVNSNPLLK